ncbi:HIT family protein [Azospirillum sp. Marseille-Q6669]
MSSPTIFSRLIAGELPCAVVYEDAETFAFMDAGQVNPGHVLVALKRPAPTILDVTEDEAAALFRTVHKVAHAVQAAFSPEGITLLQTNRPAGWQTVPHIHVHVVPRYENDGADLVWPRHDPPIEELKALAARIAAHHVVE